MRERRRRETGTQGALSKHKLRYGSASQGSDTGGIGTPRPVFSTA